MKMWKKILRRLRERERALQRLDRMTADLHASRTFDEAYAVIAHFAPRLLPGVGGALYMRENGVCERVAAWGLCECGKRKFALAECTALHRMKAHLVEGSRALGCPHVPRPTGPYVCLPLMRDGQALGVLHFQTVRQPSDADSPLKLRLAEKIACHCAQKLGELRERAALAEQAIRDTLTGLFNRRYMEESLRRELERRGRRSLGVIMLDIDHFKRFNTRFTHSGGDALLQWFGGFLQGHIRGADVACRYGGEEFLLILPGATLDVGRRRAEEIRSTVKRLRVTHHGKPLGRITVSLGVVASQEYGSSPASLLEAATRALRRAKRLGRDRVAVSREPSACLASARSL